MNPARQSRDYSGRRLATREEISQPGFWLRNRVFGRGSPVSTKKPVSKPETAQREEIGDYLRSSVVPMLIL
jgi:hypothetical protein